jgi:hypothetical protein
MSRQYYGIEALNLTAAQRGTLVDALKQLGRDNQATNPCNRNHWRVRPDNLAVLFEANWDTSDWTVEGIKTRLANLFGIDPSLVTATTQQTAYGPLVTFTRTTDRLRMIAFGGLSVTYAESHAAVLQYLAANRAAWGD